MFVERSVSYLEALRVGAVGVFTGLAVLRPEIDQVENTEGYEDAKDVLPGLSNVLKAAYTSCKYRDEEGKGHNG